MKISPHFTLHEMTKSMTATRLGIDNTPDSEQEHWLRDLCKYVLEPVRGHYGKPVRVSSGFRCKKLNTAIGGSKTSEHTLGRAADIEIIGISNLDLAKYISESDIPFNQLILEYHDPDKGPNSGWVHVSYAPENKRQTLTAVKTNRKTVYRNGLMFS